MLKFLFPVIVLLIAIFAYFPLSRALLLPDLQAVIGAGVIGLVLGWFFNRRFQSYSKKDR